MGKNWARGLTAATDRRIARAAVGHRGLHYARHTTGDRRLTLGGPRFAPPPTADAWTGPLAYAVGLIATDGCLSGDRKTVTQVSKDRELLETFKECIGSAARIGWNQRAFRVQVVDVGLYRWLQSIGLTQRKSLTLGPLDIPEHVFLDFVRGLLDGDGSIKTDICIPNPRRYPDHRYQRLTVQFHSASETHVRWLQAELRRLRGLRGWIGSRRKGRHAPVYVLRYSKHESIPLLQELYRDSGAPRLHRKWKKWVDFRDHGKPARKWTSHRKLMRGGLLAARETCQN